VDPGAGTGSGTWGFVEVDANGSRVAGSVFPRQARLGRLVAVPVGQVVCVCLLGPVPHLPVDLGSIVKGCHVSSSLTPRLLSTCTLGAVDFSSGQEPRAGSAALGARRCRGKVVQALGAVLASDCPSAALVVL